jgi:hypothetical protein
VEVGVWRDVKVVGDVVRVFFARALVRGDVDPRCSGLGAREADGGAIVIEVQASAEEAEDDHVFYLFLQKQKIGAELHVYLEEGTYHNRLFRGPNTNDMKK